MLPKWNSVPELYTLGPHIMTRIKKNKRPIKTEFPERYMLNERSLKQPEKKKNVKDRAVS